MTPRDEPTAILALSSDMPPEKLIGVVAQAAVRPVAVTGDLESVPALVHGGSADVVLVDLALAAGREAELAAVAAVAAVVALCSEQSPDMLATALALGVRGFVRSDAGPREMAAVIGSVRSGSPSAAPDLVASVLAGAAARLAGGDRQGPPSAADTDAFRASLAEPGSLFPVFQPIADLGSSRRHGWLALTRFAGAAPEETSARFARAHALGLSEELEVAAARAALGEMDRLPSPALLFVKASCTTVAGRRLEGLLDGVDASRLVIELSGVADLIDREAFNDAVDRLRYHGVRFAVDETGAGFGPLDQVLDLSPAFVRLAGGLTRGIDADRTRRALALTVISFASHLGAKVIADQIETAEELQALRRLGVGYGLGFHIGRPQAHPPRAAAASALPTRDTAAGEAPEEAATSPQCPVLWGRSQAGRGLELPSGALTSFEAASTAVLRVVHRRLPSATPYVALLDRHAAVMRVVDVGPGDQPRIEIGTSFPLAESVDELAATGRVPQLGRVGSPATGSPAHPPGVTQWAVVPFAGAADHPLATLSAVSADEPFDDAALELLRDAASTLSLALEREHGDDLDRLATALRELSGRDRLTGLLNACRFREVLAEANARAGASGSPTFVVAITTANLDGVGERMGQAVRGLVLKDVARSLALAADHVDALARVGPTTYGCVLFGRRASEVDYFCQTVADRVAADGRRRGATVELRTGTERLGLHATSDDAWQAALDRLFA